MPVPSSRAPWPRLTSVSTRSYAALGLWYDALESISDAIEAAPADAVLRSQSNELLRQADLDAAVD